MGVSKEQIRTITISPDISNSIPQIKDQIFSVLSLVDNGFRNGESICLVLRRQKECFKRKLGSSITTAVSTMTTVTTEMQFPTLDLKANLKFVCYLKVLRLLFDQLSKGQDCFVSKRQIYYMDVTLFKRQSVIDQCIDNIASSFGVSIERLGVVAAQKGLIYGDVHLSYKGREIIIKKQSGPVLLPLISLESHQEDFIFSARMQKPEEIVVVEKESVFSKLCDQGKDDKKIYITAKGFPDRLTKRFLYHLTSHFSDTKVSALVDSDVYGLMIFKDYKYAPAIRQQRQNPDSGTGCRIFKATSQFNNSGELEKFWYVPACSRLNYEGTFLFDTVNQLGHLDITLRDFNMMKAFLNTLVDIGPVGSVIGDVADKEFSKLIRETQMGLYFMKKREMN